MEPFGSTWSSKYLQGVKARQLEAKLGKKREVETGVLGGSAWTVVCFGFVVFYIKL